MRVMAGGGRGSEPRLPGPGGAGAVTVGTRTLSEGGAAGKWSREEVRESCVLCCVMFYVMTQHVTAELHDALSGCCYKTPPLLLMQPG